MSKMKYYKHAETLFLQDNLSVDEICKNLNVSRRTLFYWREKYEWDKKKAAKFAKKEAFSKELQGFVEKLMAKITTDMQNKKNCEPVGVLYSDKPAKISARRGKIRTQTTTPNSKTNRPTLRRFC